MKSYVNQENKNNFFVTLTTLLSNRLLPGYKSSGSFVIGFVPRNIYEEFRNDSTKMSTRKAIRIVGDVTT